MLLHASCCSSVAAVYEAGVGDVVAVGTALADLVLLVGSVDVVFGSVDLYT